MALDPTLLSRTLDRHPYGLILLSSRAGDDVRRALWASLGTCETLFWVGPMADKPVVAGGARCWLLECPLADRLSGYLSVTRQDPHAVHVVGALGPDDADLFRALVRGALAGHIIVAEIDADAADELAVRTSGYGIEPALMTAALLASIGADGAVGWSDQASR